MAERIEVTKEEWRERDRAFDRVLGRVGEARSVCILEGIGYEKWARDRIRLSISELQELEARLAKLEAANG